MVAVAPASVPEVAFTVMVPAVVVDWMMASAFPLKAERAVPLYDSWLVESPLSTPAAEAPWPPQAPRKIPPKHHDHHRPAPARGNRLENWTHVLLLRHGLGCDGERSRPSRRPCRKETVVRNGRVEGRCACRWCSGAAGTQETAVDHVTGERCCAKALRALSRTRARQALEGTGPERPAASNAAMTSLPAEPSSSAAELERAHLGKGVSSRSTISPAAPRPGDASTEHDGQSRVITVRIGSGSSRRSGTPSCPLRRPTDPGYAVH